MRIKIFVRRKKILPLIFGLIFKVFFFELS